MQRMEKLAVQGFQRIMNRWIVHCSGKVTRMKKKHVVLSLFLLLLVCGILGIIQSEHTAVPEKAPDVPSAQPPLPPASPVPKRVTVHMPTCTQAGYELHENPETGVTHIVDGEPALGHDFSSDGVCLRCDYVEPHPEAETGVQTDVPIDSIPSIDLKGDMEGISKEKRITLEFDFSAAQQQFSCYSFTTWQGHSSLEYPKKNYTVRLFADKGITEKFRLAFDDWQLEHKYILKANYLDVSQARNLIAARLWGEIAASRSGLHEKLRSSSNYGAVDGFPVVLRHNGEFAGLYTMNLHKDEDLYGMREGRKEAIVIINEQTTDESLFRASAVFEEDISDWELELCGTPDDATWAKDSLNELIGFVMNSSDEQFRSELQTHLDINSAIDYLIFFYAAGLKENAAKDLVLIRYEDSPWIASVYDMECAFGLNSLGTEFVSEREFLPKKANGIWNSGTGSLLWDRILQVFEPEIRARYAELRLNVLSEDNLIGRIEAYINTIPEDCYEQDKVLYPNRPLLQVDPKEQMVKYISDRLPVLDGVLMEEKES